MRGKREFCSREAEIRQRRRSNVKIEPNYRRERSEASSCSRSATKGGRRRSDDDNCLLLLFGTFLIPLPPLLSVVTLCAPKSLSHSPSENLIESLCVSASKRHARLSKGNPLSVTTQFKIAVGGKSLHCLRKEYPPSPSPALLSYSPIIASISFAACNFHHHHLDSPNAPSPVGIP